MTTIDVGSYTAQTVGNPADQITTNMTGANGNPVMARKWMRGKYRCTSKDKYSVSSP